MKQFLTITLLLSIIAGCSKNAPEATIAEEPVKTVQIAEVPLVAAFSIVDKDEVKEGFVASFQNTSTGAVSYKWDFGTGDVSEQRNPTYIFSGCGPKTVILTVIDAKGNEQTFSVQLEVHCTGKHVPTDG